MRTAIMTRLQAASPYGCARQPGSTCRTSTSSGRGTPGQGTMQPAASGAAAMGPKEFEGGRRCLGRSSTPLRGAGGRTAAALHAVPKQFVGSSASLGRGPCSSRAVPSSASRLATLGLKDHSPTTPRGSTDGGRANQCLALRLRRPKGWPPCVGGSQSALRGRRWPASTLLGTAECWMVTRVDQALSWIATMKFVAYTSAELGLAREGPGSKRVLAPRQLKTIKCTSSSARTAATRPPLRGERRRKRALLAWRLRRRTAGAARTPQRFTRPRRGLGTL